MKNPAIYIIGNDRPTLYIGVTSDLLGRIHQHRVKLADGFSKQYELRKLLYFEQFNRMEDAISREKQLKKWNREWKLRLIREFNPTFKDLYLELTDPRLREDDE